LLIPNENEASTLLGVPAKAHDPAWLAEQLQKHFGLKQIVITLGENGVYIADGDKRHTLPAFKVPVVETPGAGDCFTAGLAFGLYHDASLVDAASFACLTAARSVSIPGSIPGFGTLKEIAEFATANHFDIPASLLAIVTLAVHQDLHQGRV
jgi:ribokinase